jgi:hypothetical protein
MAVGTERAMDIDHQGYPITHRHSQICFAHELMTGLGDVEVDPTGGLGSIQLSLTWVYARNLGRNARH